MRRDAFERACRLAREAEAVCRHSLCNRKPERGDWLLGDVPNRPGRSLSVRLRDSHKGPAGKWTWQGARRMIVCVYAWALSHRRSTASPRPAANTLREVA